jgi:hypothetical protein
MRAGDEPETLRQLVDRALESGIIKRDELATLLADQVVVMMLTRRIGRLIPSDTVPEVKAAQEVMLVQQLERAVNARASDRLGLGICLTQTILDLKRAKRTLLKRHKIDQPVTSGTTMMAGLLQDLPCMLRPICASRAIHASKG